MSDIGDKGGIKLFFNKIPKDVVKTVAICITAVVWVILLTGGMLSYTTTNGGKLVLNTKEKTNTFLEDFNSLVVAVDMLSQDLETVKISVKYLEDDNKLQKEIEHKKEILSVVQPIVDYILSDKINTKEAAEEMLNVWIKQRWTTYLSALKNIYTDLEKRQLFEELLLNDEDVYIPREVYEVMMKYGATK